MGVVIQGPLECWDELALGRGVSTGPPSPGPEVQLVLGWVVPVVGTMGEGVYVGPPSLGTEMQLLLGGGALGGVFLQGPGMQVVWGSVHLMDVLERCFYRAPLPGTDM